MPESREAERREWIARILRASAIPLFLIVATLLCAAYINWLGGAKSYSTA